MNYRGYCITSTYDSGVERDNKIVEGYYCEVFRASDENYADKLDDFCLGVGYDISDISSDSLDEALKQYIDDNIVVLNDICYKANIERYKNLIQNALDWFSEHFESEELLDILHEYLDMTDEEIDYFGYDFSDLEVSKGISLIHLHEQNDDCYLYLNKPYNLFKAAIAYQYNIKNNLNHLTLDSFVSAFEDARVIDDLAYSILSRHITPDGELASIYEFDFESNILSVCNRSNCEWSRFYFCDIGEAIDEATFNDNMPVEDKHSIFIQQLIGREIEEPIDADESESPSMTM